MTQSQTETVDADQLRTIVLTTADQIHDPCALGAGMQIGMTSMGLIRDVQVRETAGRWDVSIAIRFTGPECMNYFYFKQNLETQLTALSCISSASVSFEAIFDWEETMMSDEARHLFRQRNEQLAARATPVVLAPVT